MEKLRFTFRCIIILIAFPVVMYAELTRDEKVNVEQKQTTAEKVTSLNTNEAALNHSLFMQAVNN
jgi:hypothetical protein